MPHAAFRKIIKVHNSKRMLLFIEPSECRMGREALQLLRVLQLKDTMMEATMSKVFLKKGNFTSLGKLFIMKDSGTYSLQFANNGTHFFTFYDCLILQLEELISFGTMFVRLTDFLMLV